MLLVNLRREWNTNESIEGEYLRTDKKGKDSKRVGPNLKYFTTEARTSVDVLFFGLAVVLSFESYQFHTGQEALRFVF
jgi:hypothetical protein